MKITCLMLINLSVLLPTPLRQNLGKKKALELLIVKCEMVVKLRDRDDRTGIIIFGFLSPVN